MLPNLWHLLCTDDTKYWNNFLHRMHGCTVFLCSLTLLNQYVPLSQVSKSSTLTLFPVHVLKYYIKINIIVGIIFLVYITASLFDCNCENKQQLRVAVILWTCMWGYQLLIFTELLATSPSD